MSAGLLNELVGAPDRDDLPGGLGVVSVSDGDDPEFLEDVAARQRERVRLVRRGIEHGEWAELETAGLAPEVAEGMHAWRQRWADARPVLLRGQLAGRLEAFGPLFAERARLGERLESPGALESLIEAGLGRLGPAFDVLTPEEGRPLEAAVGGDPERDLERRFLSHAELKGPGGRADFWLKSQRLSRTPQDRSGRIRISFGAEREDDASHDNERHLAIAELGRALFPETALVRDDVELLGLLDELDAPQGSSGELFLTQDIAYWNAPNGGALMHHDAFDEDYGERQRAVVYAQLTGQTAWLALSTQELAARVTEFTELIHEGDMPWLRGALFRGKPGASLMQKILKGGRFVYAELEKPGCGRLGRLVNRGPEFTSLLADAGHGFIVRAGDVLVLPNHGLGHTAMHSVFCASEDTAYSLSLALRRTPSPDDERDPVDHD